ncbi:MAG: hypothetical protein ACREBV_01945, partial [Candidatus Zixiibacteriota bacterium]
MNKACLVVLALVLGISSQALGQEEQAYVKDFMEVNLFGGGGIPSGDLKDFGDTTGAKTGFNIGLDAGFFITENLVGGLNFTFTEMSIEDNTTVGGLHHKLYNPNLYLKYYFI